MDEGDEEQSMPKTWLLLRRIYMKKLEEERAKRI